MKQDFYDFFLAASITNRRAAINAVVAGMIAGSLLSLVMGFACVSWLLRDGGKSQTTLVLLATTLTLMIITIGTWKRILSAPIFGVVVGMVTVAWALWHGQTAVAILLAVPFVGGFSTAVRGIVALKRLERESASRR